MYSTHLLFIVLTSVFTNIWKKIIYHSEYVNFKCLVKGDDHFSFCKLLFEYEV